MQWALRTALSASPLTAVNFSGVRLGRDRAELDEIAFGLASEAGPWRFELKRISADYRLYPFKLGAIGIGDARIEFAYQSNAKPLSTQSHASEASSWPFERLTVDHLRIAADTPWGIAEFDGHGEAAIDSDNSLTVQLNDGKQTLRLQTTENFRSASFELEQSAAGKVFELSADRLDRTDPQALIRAGAVPLLQWLAESRLVPQRLRTRVSSTDLPALLPGLAAVELKLTADSHDNWEHLHGWLLLTKNGDYLASADFNLAPAAGRVDVDAHFDMAAEQVLLLLKPWLPADAAGWQTGGGTQGTARIRWQAKTGITGIAHLKGWDLKLSAEGIKLDNGEFDFHVDNWAEQSAQLTVQADAIQIGTTQLAALDFSARHLAGVSALQRAQVSVFGGLLIIAPGPIDLRKRPIVLPLEVQDMDLAELLAALDYPQLSGDGRLSGKLPLRLDKEAIEMEGGVLAGTRSGKLSYLGPAADGDSLAFKALRNLVYHTLKATLDYRPNGDYRLGLRLEGHNPELMSGHPLAFNLNLSGHLPELLQRSLLSGNFERSVLEQSRHAGK